MLTFDGMSMTDNWRELGVDWLLEPSTAHQNLKKPDIAGLCASTIVVSPKYSPLFLNDFSNNVELLECNLKGEKWFAFNVVGFDKALSEEHSIRNIKNGTTLESPLQLKLNNMSDTANNKFSNLLI